MTGITHTWIGISGDYFSESDWTEGAPLPGDTLLIQSGTVTLSGTDEVVTTTLGPELIMPLSETVTLGGGGAATLVLDSAEVSTGFDISLGGDATLDAVGPVGFSGSILAANPGLTLDLNATQASSSGTADFVLKRGGTIAVTNGATLALTGQAVFEAGVLIGAGSELINDGTITLFGGTTSITAQASLTGTGTFIAGPDATLEIDSPVAPGETVLFDGAGLLDLTNPSTFQGTIENFSTGSVLNLLNIVADYATYDATTDLLTVMNGGASGSIVATVTLSGPASQVMEVSALSGTLSGTQIQIAGTPTAATSAVPPAQATFENSTGAVALGANLVNGLTAAMYTADGAVIDGTGIKIGIISDSANATLSGIVDPVGSAAAAGLLPSSGITIVSDSSASGVENEGLAMAELVHQVAPGAQIYFGTAENGPDGFAAAVNQMVADGVNVIADDWSFMNEPDFQVAGPVDTAIQNAISAGVNYFTDASNYGQAWYNAAWSPATTQLVLTNGGTAQTVTAQTFGDGTQLQTIQVSGSLSTGIWLQWAAPWPTAGTSTPDSLQMVLYDASGVPIASSKQIYSSDVGGYIPEVELAIPVESTAATYQLAIYQVAGEPAPTQIEYIMSGSPAAAQDPGGVVIDDPTADQGAGDVHGHALVPGANAVGAVYWANTPAYNVPAVGTEYFSSTGPGQLLYDQNGSPIDQVVGAPDLLGPDGVYTGVPHFQPFYGTSAATPDVAAVAALMLQADPSLTPAQVTADLEQSAVSLGLPSADQGSGLVQAPAAVTLALQQVACFLRGTRIATPRGEVRIEDLSVGEMVLTRSGDVRPVRWIGRRHIDLTRHPRPDGCQPVRIQANAVADGMPSRDLLLSGDHAIFVDDMLIPAKQLVNDRTITRETRADVTYYHVELDDHDVIFADGLTVETYLDTGDRASFDNGGNSIRLHTEFTAGAWETRGYAPLVVTGPALAEVQARLSRRAAATCGRGRAGRSSGLVAA